MTRLIHSSEIPQAYLDGLDRLIPGLMRIALSPARDLYASIAAHPDIRMCCIDERTCVVAPSAPEDVVRFMVRGGIRVIMSESIPHGAYPDTAVLNAVRVGTYLFHNTKHTDKALRDLARERGIQPIFVNQGYARCSVIPVGETALITCDRGIAKRASAQQLDVKLVSTETVLLPGEEHGFIGGASGIAPDGRIVFLGDVREHPDFAGISLFLDKHDIAYTYLENLPLFDAGSLIFF